MARVASELSSPYAKFPLKRKAWLSPAGKTAKGEAAYISAPSGSPARANYVHGPGSRGFGYYHLLTPDSYKALYARLHNQAPNPCCACSKVARQELSDFDDVKTIVYNRSVARIPDDDQGREDALAIARGEAKAVYNFTQNEQLILGAVQTGAFVAAN